MRDSPVFITKSDAARLRGLPWIERPLIQSLNPEISIYRRRDAAAATARIR